MEADDRTLTEVNRLLGFAKLDSTELKGTVQCLHFNAALDNTAYRLLEIDSHLLSELEAGHRLVARGEKADGAVLCSSERTYELREAETSNSLLLLPECQLGPELDGIEQKLVQREVNGMKYDYYELRHIKPRLKRLRVLLEENPYSGVVEDKDNNMKQYTTADLLNEVQTSEGELSEGLRVLQACQIKGFWRVLDFDFTVTVFDSILALCEEQSWSLDAVEAKQCCDILQELYPRAVVLHVLQMFSEEGLTSSQPPPDAEQYVYKLNEDRVCRLYAEMILRPQDKFNLAEFEVTWQQTVPEGMRTAFHQLEGMALLERDTRPPVIRYFNAVDLPEDIGERFNALFRIRDKWTVDEITPYVQDCADQKMGVGALLTKFCRGFKQDGIKMYTKM